MVESGDLKELARVAAEQADLSSDELFDSLCAAMKQSSRHLRDHYTITMENLFNWPETLEQAYSEYAEALGVTVAELEDEQKKQALLNHILEKGEK